MLPHRATLLSAGPLWRAHQHSHNHLWPRTTISTGGQAAGQEQGRHRQHIPHATCDLRAHLARMRLRLEPTAQQAHSVPFASIGASMLPLPHALPAMPRPTSLLPAVPGPRALCCALYRTPRYLSARLARPAAFACVVCGCVCVGWCDVPVPVDVFLPFGSAAVCCSVASAFGWFGRCVRFRFRLLV
jgi:hypothetical protein